MSRNTSRVIVVALLAIGLLVVLLELPLGHAPDESIPERRPRVTPPSEGGIRESPPEQPRTNGDDPSTDSPSSPDSEAMDSLVLSGQLLDAETGAALHGTMTISYGWYHQAHDTETASVGDFRITLARIPDADSVCIEASSLGYITQSVTLTWSLLAEGEPLIVRLAREHGLLFVRVQTRFGAPLPGYRITHSLMDGDAEDAAVTNARGLVAFCGLPAGGIAIHLRPRSRGSASRFTVLQERHLTLGETEEPDWCVFNLEAPGALTFIAVCQAVEGAGPLAVEARLIGDFHIQDDPDDIEGHTGESMRFDNINAGDYWLEVRVWRLYPVVLSLNKTFRVTVYPDEVTDLGEIVLQASGAIHVSVLDPEGVPLTDCRVSISLRGEGARRWGQVVNGTTDHGGRFVTGRLSASWAAVRVTHPQFGRESQWIQIEGETHVALRFARPAAVVVIAMSDAGLLSGIPFVVFGQGDDRPIASIMTDEGGRTENVFVQPGAYVVRAFYGSGTACSVEVMAGETAEVVYELGANDPVALRISTNSGSPVADASVTLTPTQPVTRRAPEVVGAVMRPREFLYHGTTDTDGNLLVPRHLFGDELTFALVQTADARVVFRILSAEVRGASSQHPIERRMPDERPEAATVLQGRVVDEHGAPVLGARILLIAWLPGGSGTSGECLTDADGCWALAGAFSGADGFVEIRNPGLTAIRVPVHLAMGQCECGLGTQVLREATSLIVVVSLDPNRLAPQQVVTMTPDSSDLASFRIILNPGETAEFSGLPLGAMVEIQMQAIGGETTTHRVRITETPTRLELQPAS